MSVEIQTRITISCDGEGCDESEATLVYSTPTKFRRVLALAGWTWPHRGSTRINLCGECSKTYVHPEGTVKGGRPTSEESAEGPKCRTCGKRGGPYPKGDRPRTGSLLQSGCPRCGWCY